MPFSVFRWNEWELPVCFLQALKWAQGLHTYSKDMIYHWAMPQSLWAFNTREGREKDAAEKQTKYLSFNRSKLVTLDRNIIQLCSNSNNVVLQHKLSLQGSVKCMNKLRDLLITSSSCWRGNVLKIGEKNCYYYSYSSWTLESSWVTIPMNENTDTWSNAVHVLTSYTAGWQAFLRSL